MKQSYIHVYTGTGKGKTTAAFGLALRSVLAGRKVFIGQFVKGMEYSEVHVADYIPNIEIKQFGRECFIYNEPTEEDIKAAQAGLAFMRDILAADYDTVVLDEITIALYYKLFPVEDVIEMIKARNPKTEVIITGRAAPKELIELADLVTNMDEVKHYYTTYGQEARNGIEC